MDPLAIFNVTLTIQWNKILKYTPGQFRVFTKMDTNISEIALAPFLNLNAIE